MNSTVSFDRTSLAPCGINCGTCLGYLRTRNKCCGCWPEGNKPYHCQVCRIKNCEFLEKTESKFCYECEKFPCQRLKQLDKRYQANYKTSLIGNNKVIQTMGLQAYLEQEVAKWTCPGCGSVLCVHRTECESCGKERV